MSRRSSASTRATDLLREKILAGQWAQGERLGEAELAEILAVSRTPVREALARLAAQGLVEILPNRGARVATWTAEQLREIFDLRMLLEPVACGKAVGRLGAVELDELDELALAMHELAAAEGHRDFVGLAKLNRKFHATLIGASGSPQLGQTLASVAHVSIATQNYSVYAEDALARSLAHHVEIVAALRCGNADWVESVMRSHLHNARTALLPVPAGAIPDR